MLPAVLSQRRMHDPGLACSGHLRDGHSCPPPPVTSAHERIYPSGSLEPTARSQPAKSIEFRLRNRAPDYEFSCPSINDGRQVVAPVFW
jgi:hypothetical protein